VTPSAPPSAPAVPRPLYELGPTLLVDEVDALGAIDLDDARQLCARKPPDLDGFLHCATFTHENLDGMW
jgi:hypothetical protein